MTDSNILIHTHYTKDKNIIILTLNRPMQLNAINFQLLEELRQGLDEISKIPDLGALVIRSNHLKAFCTGVDVEYIRSLTNKMASDFFSKLAETLEKIIHFPCPTIASIDGYAFGAGADIAVACDIRVGNESASFRFPGPQFGLLLGTQRLMSEVGPSVVRHLALTNQVVTAEKALHYGLLHEIAENESAFEGALKYTEMTANISERTYRLLKEISDGVNRLEPNQTTPSEYARKSVEQGDFAARFSTYISQITSNKKRRV
ncbi:enoyl-CoA hydratase/isomerase family protein [Sporosarcina soli]|uniref:Enoyl-CoA hydratase/isomerase family protein n=1 Tax=Sporosarcina soli TaxID=334736 RepID=A0ABW0TH31_9BACL